MHHVHSCPFINAPACIENSSLGYTVMMLLVTGQWVKIQQCTKVCDSNYPLKNIPLLSISIMHCYKTYICGVICYLFTETVTLQLYPMLFHAASHSNFYCTNTCVELFFLLANITVWVCSLLCKQSGCNLSNRCLLNAKEVALFGTSLFSIEEKRFVLSP